MDAQLFMLYHLALDYDTIHAHFSTSFRLMACTLRSLMACLNSVDVMAIGLVLGEVVR